MHDSTFIKLLNFAGKKLVILDVLSWSNSLLFKKFCRDQNKVQYDVAKSGEYGWWNSTSHPISKSFCKLRNLYGVSHYRDGTLRIFQWSNLPFYFWINHLSCRVDEITLQNWSWYCLVEAKEIYDSIETPSNRLHHLFLTNISFINALSWFIFFTPRSLAFYPVVGNQFRVSSYELFQKG